MEKTTIDVPIPTLQDAPTSSGVVSAFTNNPLASSIGRAYDAFHDRRASLKLSNPGSIEGVNREVTQSVLVNNMMFSGFRAEFGKIFSHAPQFQTVHSLSMGGDSGQNPWAFAAIYCNPKTFLQGVVDNDFSLQARANYRLSRKLTAKTSTQLAHDAEDRAHISIGAEYTGDDFTAEIKGINPSILENTLTGTMSASYLQSVTPRLALGFETIWQRQAASEPPMTLSQYALRYKGDDWIGSAQLLAQGVVQTSYWRRLTERIEAGVNLNLEFVGLGGGVSMFGPTGNEGLATIGTKYNFRMATFRGQVDSNGKVSAHLEKQSPQGIVFTFAGEMDHAKNAAKVGMSFQIEAPGSEEIAELQEKMAQSGMQPGNTDDMLPPI